MRLITVIVLLAFSSIQLNAQTVPNNTPKSNQAISFGIKDASMIDKMMPTILGVASKLSLDNLRVQSVKPFLMPVRMTEANGTEMTYTLAACLEYYVNLHKNYKINLSPDFIALNLKGQNRSLTFVEAFNFLSQDGTIDSAVLPYGSPRLNNTVYNSNKYKINNYLHIFNPIHKPLQKIFEIRKALLRGNPVIVEFKGDPSLQAASGVDTWTPRMQGTNTYPMMVVSYDDDKKMVELTSPWGSSWGKAGYIWVGYDYFGALAQNAFVVIPTGMGW
jgi:hypothetical protein